MNNWELFIYLLPVILFVIMLGIYLFKVLTKLIIRIRLWIYPPLRLFYPPIERVPNFLSYDINLSFWFWLRLLWFILGYIGLIILLFNYEYVLPIHIVKIAWLAWGSYFVFYLIITFLQIEQLRRDYSWLVNWWWYYL
jgi:hypothetical protein